MTHPTNAPARPPRSRSLRTAAAAGALVLAAGATTLAITSTSAQAATQTFHLYSQVDPAVTPTPTDEGNQDVSLTVTPATAAPGDPIEVVVSSTTFNIKNGPIVGVGANAEELDAVISIDGTDYVLRGPQNNQAVPANNGSTATTPTLFKAGWVVSSTPGNSSGSSDNGTGNDVAGTGGVGTTVRGAETVVVPLLAPATDGTYPITLKALLLNSLGSGAATTGTFDQPINTSSTSPKADFNNNVPSSYLVYSPTVDLVVTAAEPTDTSTSEPTDTSTVEPTETGTSTEPPVDIPTGSVGGLGIAALAAVAGIGAYAFTRRPRKARGHE